MLLTVLALLSLHAPLSPHAALARHALSPADTLHCVAAAAFLRTERHAEAIVEQDTVDDWRSGKRVMGCRITAAAPTTIGLNREAPLFYEHVRASGWTRTPDPRDSPNEGSLRFRFGRSDCLFNLNRQPLLDTNAEASVNHALHLAPGEASYQIYVMCFAAMDAKTASP